MKLMREYEQHHDDPHCKHRKDDQCLHKDCLRTYDEYHCEPCQVGVHPEHKKTGKG